MKHVLDDLIEESVHYLLGIGLVLIGVGIYLGVASTSPLKNLWAGLLFAWGAGFGLVGPLWIYLGEPLWQAWRQRKRH
jgi:hypothetical protein